MVGPEIDEIPVGSKISMSYTVDVAGKAMQPDFESVMERKFHSYLNCIEGVMHTGQRDMIRIRISKADFEAGFKFRHLGEVLYAKLKNEFEAVVDKCQVTIVVDAEERTQSCAITPTPCSPSGRPPEVHDRRVRAGVLYLHHVPGLLPSHVCIVTPERLGLRRCSVLAGCQGHQ